MGLSYDGKDKDISVGINIKEYKERRELGLSIHIGALNIQLPVEEATKFWDDLGTKLEEIADPVSDCNTKSIEELFNYSRRK